MSISITIVIVIVTCLISWQGFNNRQLFNALKHNPYEEHRDKEWYRMVSSGFLHGDVMHLGVNMYVLYTFGEFVEYEFVSHYGMMTGRLLYVLCYLLIILLADIPSFFSKRNDPGYSAIGASGGTSGIIMIFVLFNPWSMLLLFFAIPIPAIILGVGYLAYSSWANQNSNDNIDHGAHFWGAVAGIVLCIIFLPESLGIFLEKVVQIPYFN